MAGALFSTGMLGAREVNIIGLGALGSVIFQNLFRQGVSRIRLWDNDIVEARNRYNQRVFEKDIGLKKWRAQRRAARMINSWATTDLSICDRRVTVETKLSGIVIAAVDSMNERSVILQCVKNSPDVSFFADGRVGLDGGKAYGMDPNNPEHIARYEDPVHMHKDPEDDDPACKSEFPMPQNADIVGGHVLWKLNRWLHLEQGCEDPYENFTGFQFVPRYSVIVERWDDDVQRQMHTLDGNG